MKNVLVRFLSVQFYFIQLNKINFLETGKKFLGVQEKKSKIKHWISLPGMQKIIALLTSQGRLLLTNCLPNGLLLGSDDILFGHGRDKRSMPSVLGKL